MEKIQKLITMKQATSFSGTQIKRRRRELETETPNEILEEILLRLPVKSLIRFQTLSKHWSCLIRRRDFGDRYMAREKTKDPPRLLFVSHDGVHRADKTLTLDTMTLGTTSASLENHKSFELKKAKGHLTVSESCDGLFCIYGLAKRQVEVINPATAMFITLPQSRLERVLSLYPKSEPPVQGLNPIPSPAFSYFSQLGFGKDSVTGRYKIVWLYNSRPDTTCEVLDLEVKEWRFVNTTSLDHHHIFYDVRPTFVNGSFYWLSGDEEGFPTKQTKLIVFDINTEMFQLIPTPPCITRDADAEHIGICNLNGRLCVSEVNQDCKQEFWWRLNDNNNNNSSWEKIFTVDLRSTSTWFDGLDSTPLTPLAILKDSNKVILSLNLFHNLNLVAFDLDPDHSNVYHLYFSGDCGLAVPYFPSLTLF